MNLEEKNEELLSQIIKVIQNYKEPEKIMLFGSRATGTAKKTSDIDIAIFGKNWTDSDNNIINDILNEELDTALKIDVLNFYDIGKEQLKKDITEKGVVLYESGKD
ncbi:MAG: nucleotidyltransferase domain-containing protein [Elusimicrobia bacterium]|nr:nucleotidyltransferase domain-containing protein [Elusimicrobiota bacterium]